MSEDRALLKAAAKAAQLPFGVGLGKYTWCSIECALIRANANGSSTTWNPLTKDGDAFRLAVKLELSISDNGKFIFVACCHNAALRVTQSKGSDPHAATRRAIVRAAALAEKEKT